MNETHIYLVILVNVLGVVLFLYVLYLIGGISQNVKKILEKVVLMEKTTERK
jgi:hypothetical protein